jgi:hypothetical protein
MGQKEPAVLPRVPAHLDEDTYSPGVFALGTATGA